MGPRYTIATGGLLTLFIAEPANVISVWVRVMDEVSCAVCEQEITADLPAQRLQRPLSIARGFMRRPISERQMAL